jgi:hypothetical protein
MLPKILYLVGLMAMAYYPVHAQLGQEYADQISKAGEFYDKKDYLKSAEHYSRAFASNADKGTETDRYNAACSWSLAGNKDSSFKNLFRIAEKTGYKNLGHMTADADLNGLHEDERWGKLVALVKANKDKAEANLDKPLVAMLDTIYQEDQKYRLQLEGIQAEHGRDSKELKELWATIEEKDSVNLIRVKKVLDEHGWLGANKVGSQGNSTLFLVIQHADLATQEKYLPMMREAVTRGNASGSQLALLEDRVLLRNGKKQVYGSQIASDQATGEYYVNALEDPEHVDERRAAVGLGLLADYVRRWNIVWNVEEYRKKLPEYEKKLKKQ